MYEDAYLLARELEAGDPEVAVHEPSQEAEALLASSAAAPGAGESAALGIFFACGTDAVPTDDRAFLGLRATAKPPVPALIYEPAREHSTELGAEADDYRRSRRERTVWYEEGES